MTILPTYPDGYSGARKSIPQIRLRWDVQLLDPEFRRRVFAMMRAARKNGHDLGIGGAGRTGAGQMALFLSRHYQVSSGGCCSFAGARYQLRAGMAHAAPPGKSYHEETTPDSKALAVDMVGDLDWADDNCGWFGLRSFKLVNSEPWHFQPVEVPTSRSSYNGTTMHPLQRWIKKAP